MATITRTASGKKWKVQIRNGNRTIKCKTFILKKSADDWARAFESDRERMAITGDYSITLSELIKRIEEDYSEAKERADKRGEDLDIVFPDTGDFRARYWIDRFGDWQLTDITSDDIEDGLDDYENGEVHRGNGYDKDGKKTIVGTGKPRSGATVNRMKSSIAVMLRYAATTKADKKDRRNKTKLLRKVPDLKAAHRKESKNRLRYLSDTELSALLKACKASEWKMLHLLVILAINTGARQSEMLYLRWKDIDFKRRTALLRTTKNGDPRVLTFPSPAMEELERFRPPAIDDINEYRESLNQLIFASEKKPGQPFRFRKHWDKALIVAGILAKNTPEKLGFRFHDLRHTAASYLFMNGATLYEAGQVLGHK